jgi:hypothetical protein
MNTFLLLKVKEAILNNPDEVHMCQWSHCICGWTVKVATGKSVWEVAGVDATAEGLIKIAAHLLKMPFDAALSLFTCQWGQDLNEAYRSAASSAERAQVVAKVIDRVIAQYSTNESVDSNV